MVKIKICGITNIEDGRAAIDAGVDMLGVNFYQPSPRYVAPDAARQLIAELKNHNAGVEVVGVFVDEPLDSIVDIARLTAIDALQLHGDESPDYCRELRSRCAGRGIIKALRVHEDFQPSDALQYEVDAIMLDAFHRTLRGGTGQTVNFKIARQTCDLVPRLFLSGGLSPENVAAAIAEVNPYAVDACSLLESSPGQKDLDRITAFVRAVRTS